MNTESSGDMKLSPMSQAMSLVSEMTLDEKVGQLLAPKPTAAIKRLGISPFNWWNEVLHGVAFCGKATVFPQVIAMAASFNPALVKSVATAISDELRAKYHSAMRREPQKAWIGPVCLSPNINIFRDPRWGRGQETFGEDPYLTARMGCSFVEGLQGADPASLKTVAVVKHFAVHSGPESERHAFDAVCSKRDLFETYLPAFKACIQEAGVAGVMGAYNRTNGEPCCASPTLLKDILRDRWGFEGVVVSDAGAVSDFHRHHHVTETEADSAVLALRNGCDLDLGWEYRGLAESVQEGKIPESVLDESVARLLALRIRLGELGPQTLSPYQSVPESIVNGPAHRELALQAARESMVLLKNEGNILPLKKELRGVAVVGPNARNVAALEANYKGFSPQMVTPFDGILEKLSVDVQVTYHEGCDLAGEKQGFEKIHRQLYLESTRMTGETEETVRELYGDPDLDAIIAVLGLTAEIEGEEGFVIGKGDRDTLDLPGKQIELLKKLKSFGIPMVVVVMAGSPVNVSQLEPYADALIYAWYPGEQGGRAIADVIFGDYNPAGRLPVTFVRSTKDLPDFKDYSMDGRTYRFLRGKPAYYFGYGLSYTTFEYKDPSVEKIGECRFRVSATVMNTGSCAGDEVVQLYLRDVQASVPVPTLQLRGVQRVHLAAGEEQTLFFELSRQDFVCFSDEGEELIEPGDFEVSIGGGQPIDPCSQGLTMTLTLGNEVIHGA